MEYTLHAIQTHVGGAVDGNADAAIVGVNALELAQSGELTFAESTKYAPQVQQSRATAFIVPPAFPAVTGRTFLRVENPRTAFIKALYLFQAERPQSSGVHWLATLAAIPEVIKQLKRPRRKSPRTAKR